MKIIRRLKQKVGEQRRGPGHSVADSKAASASHWNKLVSIPVLNRLDRAETGDIPNFGRLKWNSKRGHS
jgi:hypothetical protein